MSAGKWRAKNARRRAHNAGPKPCQRNVTAEDGARRLVSAILLQAIRDAANGKKTAKAWLVTSEANHWADAIGLAWPPTDRQIAAVKTIRLTKKTEEDSQDYL